MPSLLATLGVNISQFKRGLDDAHGHARKTGHSISSALGEELSGKLANFASVAAVEEGVRHAVEYADKIADIAHRTGVSIEAAQAWDKALQLNGSSIDSAVGFFEKLATARDKALKGDDAKLASFGKFGLSSGDLKTMRLEDLGAKIGQAFSEGGDPQKFIADLRAIGGRGAGEMVAAFRGGLPEMVKANMEAASTMSTQTVESIKHTTDQLKSIWIDLRAGIGTIVAEPLAAVVGGIKTAVDTVAMAGRMIGGFSVGGFKGANQAAEDFNKEREKIKAAEEKAGKGGAQGKESDEEVIGKNILHLKEELRKKTEANALAEMTAQEKILELERRKAALKTKISSMSAEDQIKAQMELADIDKGLRTAGSEYTRDQQQARKSLHMDTNSLQRIGAYSASPEFAVLDVEKRSERHLEQINKNIARILAAQSQTAIKKVQY